MSDSRVGRHGSRTRILHWRILECQNERHLNTRSGKGTGHGGVCTRGHWDLVAWHSHFATGVTRTGLARSATAPYFWVKVGQSCVKASRMLPQSVARVNVRCCQLASHFSGRPPGPQLVGTCVVRLVEVQNMPEPCSICWLIFLLKFWPPPCESICVSHNPELTSLSADKISSTDTLKIGGYFALSRGVRYAKTLFGS